MRTEGFPPGVKVQTRDDNHSHPSSVEVKTGGAILLLPHVVVLNQLSILSTETNLPSANVPRSLLAHFKAN
jgi:hypothetical protein